MTDDDLNAIRAILTTTEGEWSALECLRHPAGSEELTMAGSVCRRRPH